MHGDTLLKDILDIHIRTRKWWHSVEQHAEIWDWCLKPFLGQTTKRRSKTMVKWLQLSLWKFKKRMVKLVEMSAYFLKALSASLFDRLLVSGCASFSRCSCSLFASFFCCSRFTFSHSSNALFASSCVHTTFSSIQHRHAIISRIHTRSFVLQRSDVSIPSPSYCSVATYPYPVLRTAALRRIHTRSFVLLRSDLSIPGPSYCSVVTSAQHWTCCQQCCMSWLGTSLTIRLNFMQPAQLYTSVLKKQSRTFCNYFSYFNYTKVQWK